MVQAPTWTIEFERERAKQRAREEAGKAPNSAKKRKKEPKPRVPEGAVSWSEENLTKLVENPPEALRPHLRITASMVLALIARPGGPSAVAFRAIAGAVAAALGPLDSQRERSAQ